MAIVNLRIANKQLRDRLRFKAQDLLKAGHDVISASAILAKEFQCPPHIAQDVCQWVKTYYTTRYKKKRNE